MFDDEQNKHVTQLLNKYRGDDFLTRTQIYNLIELMGFPSFETAWDTIRKVDSTKRTKRLVSKCVASSLNRLTQFSNKGVQATHIKRSPVDWTALDTFFPGEDISVLHAINYGSKYSRVKVLQKKKPTGGTPSDPHLLPVESCRSLQHSSLQH